MTTTRPLFLKLSTGPLDLAQIVAVNLDTWHIDGKCNAVVVFPKDDAEPLYFPHGTADAEAVKAWADSQLGEQFLRLPLMLFAGDLVEIARLDDTGNVSVQLAGDPLRFVFPGVIARHALPSLPDHCVSTEIRGVSSQHAVIQGGYYAIFRFYATYTTAYYGGHVTPQ